MINYNLPALAGF